MVRSDPARLSAGSLQATLAARGGAEGWFFRNSPFRPLRSRHFIIWDHSVKQYDAAHFYLSRFTKPPFSPRRSNKSLRAAPRTLASTASLASEGERKGAEESRRRARAPRRPRERGLPGPRAQVTGPRVWPGRDTPLPVLRPSWASPWNPGGSAFLFPRATCPPRPHRFLNHCRSIYWEQTNSLFWKRFNCWLDGWGTAAGGRAGKGLMGKRRVQRPSAAGASCMRAQDRSPRVPLPRVLLHFDLPRRRCFPRGSAPSGGRAGRTCSAPILYTLSRPGKFAQVSDSFVKFPFRPRSEPQSSPGHPLGYRPFSG